MYLIRVLILVANLFLVCIVNAASGKHQNNEVLSASEVKFLGTWEGEVIFNNEYRYWYLTRKRDRTISYKFKVCDEGQTKCEEWDDFGYWYTDQNFYYALWPSENSNEPDGFVYRYSFLDDGCIHFGMVGSTIEVDGSKDPNDYVDKYKFQDCKVN